MIICIQENEFENAVFKMAAILSQPQCVDTLLPGNAMWHQRTWSSLV